MCDVFSWRLELEQFEPHFGGFGYISIGITDTIDKDIVLLEGYHWVNYEDLQQARLISNIGSHPYGVKNWNTNDIIELKFHQKDNKLEYLVNGVSQGIACDNIPKGNYRLVVTVQWTKSKITILK